MSRTSRNDRSRFAIPFRYMLNLTIFQCSVKVLGARRLAFFLFWRSNSQIMANRIGLPAFFNEYLAWEQYNNPGQIPSTIPAIIVSQHSMKTKIRAIAHGITVLLSRQVMAQLLSFSRLPLSVHLQRSQWCSSILSDVFRSVVKAYKVPTWLPVFQLV